MKQTIKLTESELRGMISEAVNEAVAYRTQRINEGKRNNTVKLTESQLREMINAAVNEALTQSAYANLAGQANGATSTLGGKIKGLFNPKWKERKQRQEKNFARAATHYGGYGSPHLKDDEEGFEYAAKNNGSSYDVDNYYHNYDKGKGFNLRRVQYNHDPDTPGKIANFGPDDEKKMSGRNYYRQERDRMGIEKFSDSEQEKLATTNFRLNNAYDNGKRNAMGKMKPGTKNFGGQDITGTGRNNYWVKGRK